MSIIKKGNRKIWSNLIIIISFILLSIISVIILFKSGRIVVSADMQFHMRRVLELKDSIVHWNFFPKFSFNYFHGSANLLMYPYLNIYILAVLSFAINNMVFAIYFYFMLLILGTLFVSYYSSLKISSNVYVSYLFAVIYSVSITFMSLSVVEMGLGTTTVIMFLPLVFFGVIDFIDNDNIFMVTTGMIFILYSHVLSVFISLLMIISMLIAYKVKMNKEKIKKIILSCFIVAITTIPTWGFTGYFLINNWDNIYPPFQNNLRGYNLGSLLSTVFGLNTNYLISIFSLFGLTLSIFLIKKTDKKTRILVYLSWIYIFIGSSLFPWWITDHGILKFVEIFQFTWRFSIISNLILSYLFSWYINKIFKNSLLKKSAIIFITLMSVSSVIIFEMNFLNKTSSNPYFNNNYVKHHDFNEKVFINGNNLYYFLNIKGNNNFKNFIEEYNNITNGDYTPSKDYVFFDDVNKNMIKTAVSGKRISTLSRVGYNTFSFKLNSGYKKIVLPVYYYRNEHIKILLDNKIVKYKVYNNRIAIIRISKGIHKVKIVNNELIQIIMELINLFSILIGFTLILMLFFKE